MFFKESRWYFQLFIIISIHCIWKQDFCQLRSTSSAALLFMNFECPVLMPTHFWGGFWGCKRKSLLFPIYCKLPVCFGNISWITISDRFLMLMSKWARHVIIKSSIIWRKTIIIKPEGTKALHFSMSEHKSFHFGVNLTFVISPFLIFFSCFEIEDGTWSFQK